MADDIPMEEAVRLCAGHRDALPVRMFGQCGGCPRFSKGDPRKMCVHRPPDNRGCGFVTELLERPR